MWFLLIIFLTTGQEAVLNHFTSAEDCQAERNRIGFDMAAAYPYDRDFVIACRL